MNRSTLRWACLFGGLIIVGCTSTKTSNTARTAREQLLLSNSVDQALSKVDFASFHGVNVFIDDKYLDCVDKGYVIGSMRHRAMMNGAFLATKPEEADVVLEVRSGGVGTDSSDAFLGTPELTLPGMMTLPEVRLVSRTQQTATAKLGIVAYDPKTKTLLGEGGVSSSRSDDNNVFVFGVGPYRYGSLKQETDRTIPRYANQPYQEVPAQIAFQGQTPLGHPPVAPVEQPGGVRLTGEEKPAAEAK